MISSAAEGGPGLAMVPLRGRRRQKGPREGTAAWRRAGGRRTRYEASEAEDKCGPVRAAGQWPRWAGSLPGQRAGQARCRATAPRQRQRAWRRRRRTEGWTQRYHAAAIQQAVDVTASDVTAAEDVAAVPVPADCAHSATQQPAEQRRDFAAVDLPSAQPWPS